MTHPLAPTTVLPPLALLQKYPEIRVQEALGTLRNVYFPSTASATNAVPPALKQTLTDAVHSTRPRRRVRRLVHRDDELLRADELERGFAIKWLTGLVKRSDVWVYADGEEEEQLRAGIIDDASKLLARFAGDDESEEAVTRKFSFPFYTHAHACRQASESPRTPIIVELNDAPLDTNDHTSVGLQSWGSAIILAERICADPERYLGVARSCRVLELGAGTGLLSIAASRIFSGLKTEARVVATDYHPSVLENLEQNVVTNDVDVAVEALDWSCPSLDSLEEAFDVVLAADVVYHPEHARWIRECVGRVMEENGVFWLIIPLRTIGRHEGMSKTVEDVFPDAGLLREKAGRCLTVVHREEVGKQDGIGRADEGGYRLFEIRWV
ncbi:S-adenosyl-L-methionine-dependent methyltransferase [Phlebopus sp. FC_14]|nr:S-adenosyl-L-methionine-dependent methyltransferase [Phlebopus sp. FC_14]